MLRIQYIDIAQQVQAEFMISAYLFLESLKLEIQKQKNTKKRKVFKECLFYDSINIHAMLFILNFTFIISTHYSQLLEGYPMENAKSPEEEFQQNQKEEKPSVESDPWFDDEDSISSEEKEKGDVCEYGESLVIEAETKPKELMKQELHDLAYDFEKMAIQNRSREYAGYDHIVDSNYLILLIVLSGNRMIDLKKISGLKEGYIDLVGKLNKMIVKTVSQQEANLAIEKISDFIDRLSIVKLQIKGETANNYLHFQKLKDFLRKDKIVLFENRHGQSKSLFIGGEMKNSELRMFLQKIKSIKVHQIYLKAFRNTRSYKIIIGQLLNMEQVQKEFIKFNQVNFSEVQRRNHAKQLRITVGTISKKEYTPNDYEDFFMKLVRKYYVLTFCFHSSEQYMEKPKVDRVTFKIVNQRKVYKSYMYIMALREDFIGKQQEIFNQIKKIGTRIIGVRFFYHINPRGESFMFERSKYYFFRFPQSRPYSISFAAKTKQGHTFNWQGFFKGFIEILQESKIEKVHIQ